MAFDAKGKVVDEKDWKVNFSLAAENKAADKKSKITATLDIKGSDIGGAKASMNASIEYNEKKAITAKPSLNIEISDEFNVGVSVKTDLAKAQEIRPQFVWKPAGKDSFYWARADMTRSWFMVGCDQKLNENINHSFELLYGAGKDFKGFYGQPV